MKNSGSLLLFFRKYGYRLIMLHTTAVNLRGMDKQGERL